jgi:GDPmannose 4,6-dehydratase
MVRLSYRLSLALGSGCAAQELIGFWAAKDYVEGMWLMLQQDKPDDFVLATGILSPVYYWFSESDEQIAGETHPVREFVEKAFKIVGIDIA